MSDPFLIAQLSDLHIGATWADADPDARAAAAVAAVRRLHPAPQVVVVTGDVADHGRDEEYARAQALLAPLRGPTYVLPGNHDDRATMRRHFRLPGRGAEAVHYAFDAGPLRFIVLDTTIPGEAGGALEAPQLEWLERELAARPDTPTLLAMHHPPFMTGVPAWDALAMSAPEQAALRDLVGRHRQVRRLLAGHIHRVMSADLGPCDAVTIPSTYIQLGLDFNSGELELADEPAAYALHTVVDGRIVTHVQPVVAAPGSR